MANLTNITIQVPLGATQHGNEHILCVRGPQWKDAITVATFFATNYIAHAATVKSTPGEGALVMTCNIILALMFPMSGLLRAINAIARLARSGGSELRNACYAGALCMVVRGRDWMPKPGEAFSAALLGAQIDENISDDEAVQPATIATEAEIITYLAPYAREDSSRWAYFDTIGSRAYVDQSLTNIHGQYDLPPGYEFAIVPRNTCLQSMASAGNIKETHLSSGYSIAKALASLIQALAAFATLLGHRSDLINRWGYASFHLTVIPYLFMTVMNFISNMLTADYPCLFMVETETMQEARERNGFFEGTVATTIHLESPMVVSRDELDFWTGFKPQDMREVAGVGSNDIFGGILSGSRSATKENTGFVNVRLERDVKRPMYDLADEDAEPQDSSGVILLSNDQRRTFMVQPNLHAGSRSIRRAIKNHFKDLDTQYSSILQAVKNLFEDAPSSSIALGGPISFIALILVSSFSGRFLLRFHDLSTSENFVQGSFLQRLRIGYRVMINEFFSIIAGTKTTPATERQAIYVSACSRFKRDDDEDEKVASRRKGHPGWTMLLEVLIGCSILGIVFVFIAWLSDWFSPGHSSTTERVIMLLWICEGTFGLLLPLVSAKELLMVFVLLPLFAIYGSHRVLNGFVDILLYLMAFSPLGIFVAPIWGFVLVGKMLLEWGNCVSLF